MMVANTVNAYLSFRAAIRAVKLRNREVPGTISQGSLSRTVHGSGEMPTELCARQMAAAYETCVLNQAVVLPDTICSGTKLNSPRSEAHSAAGRDAAEGAHLPCELARLAEARR
jgi:hypothetical protein